MAVCVGMKIQGQLIDDEVDRHGVVQRNGHSLLAAGDFNVFCFSRNAEFLDFLQNVVANIVWSLAGISGSREERFRFDGMSWSW